MSSAAKALPAVLAHIDGELDNSINRLFDFVRIPSISTDSAYKDFCRSAAEFVAKDLESLGFEAAVRATAGHPVVTAKSNGATAANNGPRVLFYGHYDVQPVDPLNLWNTPPFEPKIDSLPDGRRIIHGRGACDDKGQFMTFVEACRAFKAVTGKLPLDITMMIEGEEECGSKSLFDFVRSNASAYQNIFNPPWRTGSTWSSALPGRPTAPFLPDLTFQNPFPTSVQSGPPSNPLIYMIERDNVNPVTQQWNLTVEQVANVSPSKYAVVVLSDVASLPGQFESELNIAEPRSRSDGGRCAGD